MADAPRPGPEPPDRTARDGNIPTLAVRSRTPGRVVALVVVLAFLVSGCNLLPMAEDQGRGMTIWNRTAKSVQIEYRRVVGNREQEDPVVEVAPNQRVLVVGLHQAEGACLRGTLLATQDGRTIATLAQPCQGAEWVIPGP